MSLLPFFLDELEEFTAPPAKRYLNIDIHPFNWLSRPSLSEALLLDNTNTGYRRRRKLGKALKTADAASGDAVKNTSTIGKDGFQVCLGKKI